MSTGDIEREIGKTHGGLVVQSDRAWVVEMQGPAYLSARQLGGYEFYWTDDHYKALRFFTERDANLVMMAVRQLRGDLFPSCLTQVPRATEHVWSR